MAERESNLTLEESWTSPPSSLKAEPGYVDVWRVPLDVKDGTLQSLAGHLDETERQRADRFRIEAKRTEFIVTRGCLRQILSQLISSDLKTEVTPCDIEFDYLPHGKPILTGKWKASEIQFNATHSHGLALIAATRSSRIGVDVERVRDNRDVQSLARRWFSQNEVEELRSLPTNQQSLAFFLGWTRKEAFVKAVGDGITYGLDQFDVSLSPGHPSVLKKINNGRTITSGWSLLDIKPSNDHAAAMAIEAGRVAVRQWAMLP